MIEHPGAELLSAHLDGVLDRAELAVVETHLSRCSECARRLAMLRATSLAVAGLPGEQPGPLDLSFLPPAPSNVVSLPSSRGRRLPAWAAPLLASAAVLVVAGGLGTLMLRHPATTPGTATALNSQERGLDASPRPGEGSVAGGLDRSGQGAAVAPAGPAALSTGSYQYSTGSSRGVRAVSGIQSFPGSGGATVALEVSMASVGHGQGIQVSMSVRAGSTALDARALQVTVGRLNESALVLGTGEQTIPPGHSATLYGTWVAGQLNGDSTAPGDYRLEAHVLLFDGTDLSVNLPVHVT